MNVQLKIIGKPLYVVSGYEKDKNIPWLELGAGQKKIDLVTLFWSPAV